MICASDPKGFFIIFVMYTENYGHSNRSAYIYMADNIGVRKDEVKVNEFD
ncbi:hypothetical protein SAMN05428981_103430 [Bacillus sp. OV194]|nr:hypothetical protein SAMN05428981_103430 [Bacillus sp. OV194]